MNQKVQALLSELANELENRIVSPTAAADTLRNILTLSKELEEINGPYKRRRQHEA